MSNIIRNYAKTVRVGNAIAKQVYLELADCADQYGYADETIEQIAETLEISEISVKRAIHVLVEKTLIRRHDLPKQKGQWIRRATYIVLPDRIKQRLTQSLITQGYKLNVCEIPGDTNPRISEIPSDISPSICEIRGDQENASAGYLLDSSPGISQTGYLRDTFHIEDSDKEDVDLNTENTKTVCACDAGAPDDSPKIEIVNGRRGIPLSEIVSPFPENFPDYKLLAVEQLCAAMKIKSLPEKSKADWISQMRWAFENDFSPDYFVECYVFLSKQKWRTSRVTPETVAENLPNFENLKEKTKQLEQNGANQNGIIPTNNQPPRFESSNERRDREARSRVEFGNAANELLRGRGII